MVLVLVSHMRQLTLPEFQISPFRVIMCVIAPVTLSSNGNNLANSRLFNLLQPISTLFNYLCLVTVRLAGPSDGCLMAEREWKEGFRFRAAVARWFREWFS